MKKQPNVKVPPIWVALVLSIAGIIGTRMVYASVTGNNSLINTLVGSVLLVGAVVAVGTPLAFSMHLRRELKARKRSQMNGSRTK
ncbi:hypothetical protein [Alicyclobacillus ferrooxydans]|uniref:Uncharacterized protein n=1 Tax=Alicyclobacillus ferrooxydans TaxID=471514 RepID=A0A0P9C6Q4_9BACL|nr:hypothetical protein [Alicyclobacillus ferrooxydans]KPV40820.1 hypothetical protein AN477_21190 [Alicyclobacillus ferrooxydans]